MGRTAEMLIECTSCDRPSLLASTTTMQQADIGYTLTFQPATESTRMRWSGRVRPKGAFRLLGPVVTWMGHARNSEYGPASNGTWKQRLQKRPPSLSVYLVGAASL